MCGKAWRKPEQRQRTIGRGQRNRRWKGCADRGARPAVPPLSRPAAPGAVVHAAPMLRNQWERGHRAHQGSHWWPVRRRPRPRVPLAPGQWAVRSGRRKPRQEQDQKTGCHWGMSGNRRGWAGQLNGHSKLIRGRFLEGYSHFWFSSLAVSFIQKIWHMKWKTMSSIWDMLNWICT